MQVFNLDENDDADIIIIWNAKYEIWDIPVRIYEKIQGIKTRLLSEQMIANKWKKVIIELLEIKNKVVEKDKISDKHILKLIEIISNKIKNQDDYKKQI